MRPRRLEIAGFTAFRDPVDVDFDGADLFALTGPTGSGKSSLIDAIVFALYGSVPRIGQREVAPIVSLGKLEARVRFEFSLDGAVYTVVRVVRRTKSGATTAEARLEQAGDVLAGSADEVTATVERLFGLGFDHFTKSVVLPQGQFAAFLHDRPAERQKLLRELLDLGVYERMRDLANQRRNAAEAEARVLAAQLDELAFAGPEAERAAEGRLRELEALCGELEREEPDLVRLRGEIAALRKAAGEARASLALLDRIEIPEGTEAFAVTLAEARDAASAAVEAAGRAAEDLEAARRERAALPPAGELERVIELHEQVASERRALDEATREAELTSAVTAADRRALESARQQLDAARQSLDRLNREHAANALAAALVAGEPCPVCRQPVAEPPARKPPAALTGAQQTLDQAEERERAARTAADRSDRRLAALQARVNDLAGRVALLDDRLKTAPGLGEARTRQEAAARADARLEAARRAADQAAGSSEEGAERVADLQERAAEARGGFDGTRDTVAALGPPIPQRLDLAADWKELTAWAKKEAEAFSAVAGDADRAVRQIQADLADREDAIARRLEAAGLDALGKSPRDAAVAAAATAGAELTRIREAAGRAARLRESIGRKTEVAEVAKALGRHLAADGFEAWLMEEAHAALVHGANLLLNDLTGGAYSLEVVKRDFRVIDHRNADQGRGVRTLSGGETFLASLALALALAEQLAAMSVHGGGRLESIFLDEGFGTLDAETLDTVAHVIQELGARGRTVGIVTHVRELAEQVPVRFEVRREGSSATVERVEL